MVWKNILKEDDLSDIDDFMDLGDDHHQTVSKLVEDLVRKIINERLAETNKTMEDLGEDQFRKIMDEAMEMATPMVTEVFVSRLRDMQNRIREEYR